MLLLILQDVVWPLFTLWLCSLCNKFELDDDNLSIWVLSFSNAADCWANDGWGCCGVGGGDDDEDFTKSVLFSPKFLNKQL